MGVSISASNIHPGEILNEEFLKPHGLTPHDISAYGLGKSWPVKFVLGRAFVHPPQAVILGKLCGTSFEFWLNLQHEYDVRQAKEEAKDYPLHTVPTLKQIRSKKP